MIANNTISKRVYLRKINLADVSEKYKNWMNDKKVTCYLESRFQHYTMDDITQYVAALQNDRDNFLFGIFVNENDVHIGNIKLGPVNWTHKFGEIGLMIGEKNCWGKGYATEAIKLISDFAFSELNLNKVIAGCYDVNLGSIKAFQKAGFVIEGVLNKHFLFEDNYVDAIRLGLLRKGN